MVVSVQTLLSNSVDGAGHDAGLEEAQVDGVSAGQILYEIGFYQVRLLRIER